MCYKKSFTLSCIKVYIQYVTSKLTFGHEQQDE